MTQEWVEVPWNWVTNQWAEVTRVYSRGFGKIIYSVFILEELGPELTRVSTYYGAVARGLVGKLALKYGFPTLQKTFQDVLTKIAEQLAALKPALAMPGPEALSPTSEQKLREAKQRMVGQGLDVACIDQLFGWIRTGDEADLQRIQVRERARKWGLD